MKPGFLSFAACLAASGCQAVLGDFPEDAELRCEGRLLPLDPALEQGLGELVFVQRNTIYAANTRSPDSEPFGFDLDQGATCTPPAWAAPPADRWSIDNAFAAASSEVSTIIGGVTANQFIAATAENGHGNTLISIFGYNGESDDPEIEVAVYDASMGDRRREDHDPPRWDGTDTWHVNSKYVVAADGCWTPRMHARGTVTNWTVVTSVFSDGPDIRELRWRATLVNGDDGWKLRDGTLGCLWRIDDLLGILAGIGGEYCTASDAYPIFRKIYCENVDMDSDRDGICDALSVGSVFEAEPARIGGVRDYSTIYCAPEENPATYGCDRDPPR